jgi:hypothetical protein
MQMKNETEKNDENDARPGRLLHTHTLIIGKMNHSSYMKQPMNPFHHFFNCLKL